jgi:hypothetical protein
MAIVALALVRRRRSDVVARSAAAELVVARDVEAGPTLAAGSRVAVTTTGCSDREQGDEQQVESSWRTSGHGAARIE